MKDDFFKKLLKGAKEVVCDRVNFDVGEVCKTPDSSEAIDIPFPNIGKASDGKSGSKKLKVDGDLVNLKDSVFGMSSGDKEGSKRKFRKVR